MRQIEELLKQVQWEEVPGAAASQSGGLYATHAGVLELGALGSFRCFRLNDGRAVIHSDDMERLLRMILPTLRPQGEDSYVTDEGHTMRREEGLTPNGNPIRGRWVLRNADGSWIGYDENRLDLATRYGFRLA